MADNDNGHKSAAVYERWPLTGPSRAPSLESPLFLLYIDIYRTPQLPATVSISKHLPKGNGT